MAVKSLWRLNVQLFLELHSAFCLPAPPPPPPPWTLTGAASLSAQGTHSRPGRAVLTKARNRLGEWRSQHRQHHSSGRSWREELAETSNRSSLLGLVPRIRTSFGRRCHLLLHFGVFHLCFHPVANVLSLDLPYV